VNPKIVQSQMCSISNTFLSKF